MQRQHLSRRACSAPGGPGSFTPHRKAVLGPASGVFRHWIACPVAIHIEELLRLLTTVAFMSATGAAQLVLRRCIGCAYVVLKMYRMALLQVHMGQWSAYSDSGSAAAPPRFSSVNGLGVSSRIAWRVIHLPAWCVAKDPGGRAGPPLPQFDQSAGM